jgi:hypothetical protein
MGARRLDLGKSSRSETIGAATGGGRAAAAGDRHRFNFGLGPPARDSHAAWPTTRRTLAGSAVSAPL